MKSPLALNNECVTLMQRGCFVEAIECAREAIGSMQAGIGKDALSAPGTSLSFTPIESLVIRTVPEEQTLCNAFYLYNRAFVFVNEIDIQICQRETAAVLFYNLALASHAASLSITSIAKCLACV